MIQQWRHLLDSLRRLTVPKDSPYRERCIECGAGVGSACRRGCVGPNESVPEPDRDTPAGRATAAMRAFTRRRTATMFREEEIAGMIADLMHLAERVGIEPGDVIDRAVRHHRST